MLNLCILIQGKHNSSRLDRSYRGSNDNNDEAFGVTVEDICNEASDKETANNSVSIRQAELTLTNIINELKNSDVQFSLPGGSRTNFDNTAFVLAIVDYADLIPFHLWRNLFLPLREHKKRSEDDATTTQEGNSVEEDEKSGVEAFFKILQSNMPNGVKVNGEGQKRSVCVTAFRKSLAHERLNDPTMPQHLEILCLLFSSSFTVKDY